MATRLTARITMLAACLLSHGMASAETYVTGYVLRVQEERERTRWTLTEWLRIKERMRLMDVWLAMFSDPKKDSFRPELNVVYGMTRGDLQLTDAAGVNERAVTSGAQGRAQLWLTNILSGVVGVRTLNIDFGLEAFGRSTGALTSAPVQAVDPNAATAEISAESPAVERMVRHSYGAVALRLFGKSIQDSAIVLKYGRYDAINALPSWSASSPVQGAWRGLVAGGEGQVYLLPWIGVEGNYLAYGNAVKPSGSPVVRGHYEDYAGFVEVSLLRLLMGAYREEWSFENDGNRTQTKEYGLLTGAKLQF